MKNLWAVLIFLLVGCQSTSVQQHEQVIGKPMTNQTLEIPVQKTEQVRQATIVQPIILPQQVLPKKCSEACSESCEQSAQNACMQPERASCRANCGEIIDPSACTQACTYLSEPSACKQFLEQFCKANCNERC